MGQLLDFRRFYLLLCKQWFENRKSYGLFFLTIAAFFIGWFAFTLMIGNPRSFGASNQATIYFAGLFIAGCLSASFLIRDFTSKPRQINFHALPAAALEKLLCVLFYGVLIFFIGYNIIFYVTDYLAIKMANTSADAMMMSRTAEAIEWRQRFGLMDGIPHSSPINIFTPSADLFVFYPGDNVDLFTAFFPVQSVFILGSIYFAKNSFFKTLVVLLVIWLLFFILEDKLLFPLLPGNARSSNFVTTCEVPDNNGNETYYTLPFWIGTMMKFAARFLVTPAIWLAAYYRLKEKEI